MRTAIISQFLITKPKLIKNKYRRKQKNLILLSENHKKLIFFKKRSLKICNYSEILKKRKP